MLSVRLAGREMIGSYSSVISVNALLFYLAGHSRCRLPLSIFSSAPRPLCRSTSSSPRISAAPAEAAIVPLHPAGRRYFRPAGPQKPRARAGQGRNSGVHVFWFWALGSSIAPVVPALLSSDQGSLRQMEDRWPAGGWLPQPPAAS